MYSNDNFYTVIELYSKHEQVNIIFYLYPYVQDVSIELTRIHMDMIYNKHILVLYAPP